MVQTARKALTLMISVLLLAGLLAGCGRAAEDADVNQNMQNTINVSAVTIVADGRQYIIENCAGKTVEELLDEAGVSLGSSDILSVDKTQPIGDGMIIQVLRTCSVIVAVEGETPASDIIYRLTLIGGTVQDALDALELTIADNQTVTPEPDTALEDGMQIAVSMKAEEITLESEETDKEENDDLSSEPDSSEENSSWSDNSYSGNYSGTSGGSYSGGSAGSSENSSSESTGSDETTETEEPAVTVVSEDYYYDCDGSGHGVKVITYSDGSQEEVEF